MRRILGGIAGFLLVGILLAVFSWALVNVWEREIIAEERDYQDQNIHSVYERAEVSYYSSPEHGRFTAWYKNGRPVIRADSTRLDCATMEPVPFGSYLLFINPDNGRAVRCRVVDRMSKKILERFPLRKYDLSKAAAESLGIVRAGHQLLLITTIEP